MLSLKVTVNSPANAAPYSSTLCNDLERIGRMLAGGHLPSIAKAVFANNDLRKLLLTKFLDLVNQECNDLCRKNPASVSPFRCIPIDKLSDFSWDELVNVRK